MISKQKAYTKAMHCNSLRLEWWEDDGDVSILPHNFLLQPDEKYTEELSNIIDITHSFCISATSRGLFLVLTIFTNISSSSAINRGSLRFGFEERMKILK